MAADKNSWDNIYLIYTSYICQVLRAKYGNIDSPLPYHSPFILTSMRRQTTRHILMVRPARFAFNEETAANNAFQVRDGQLSPEEIRRKAQAEFDGFVQQLRKAGVQVIVAKDSHCR